MSDEKAMADVRAMNLRLALFAELEKAHNIIGVLLYGHLSGKDRERAVEDLKNRGFGDHEQTRAELLRG